MRIGLRYYIVTFFGLLFIATNVHAAFYAHSGGNIYAVLKADFTGGNCTNSYMDCCVEVHTESYQGIKVDLSPLCYIIQKQTNVYQMTHAYARPSLTINGKAYSFLWHCPYCSEVTDGEGIADYYGGTNILVSHAVIFTTLASEDNSTFSGSIHIDFTGIGKPDVTIEGVLIPNQPAIDARVTKLEEWKTSIAASFDSLSSNLHQLKNWLFFWNYNATGNSVCNAVATECKAPVIKCRANTDCGTDGYVGSPSCSGNTVFQSYVAFKCNNAGLSTAYCSNTTTSQLKTTCPKKCLNAACVDCLTAADCSAGQSCVNNVCQGTTPPPSGKCSFRTNATNGKYGSGTWIAVDTNGDGKLEGYSYTSSSGLLIGCSGTLLAKTPQGYDVRIIGGKPYVCMPGGSEKVEKIYGAASTTAVTSSSPTAPYTANGQEVCQA
jgi:hypothetical protein